MKTNKERKDLIETILNIETEYYHPLIETVIRYEQPYIDRIKELEESEKELLSKLNKAVEEIIHLKHTYRDSSHSEKFLYQYNEYIKTLNNK